MRSCGLEVANELARIPRRYSDRLSKRLGPSAWACVEQGEHLRSASPSTWCLQAVRENSYRNTKRISKHQQGRQRRSAVSALEVTDVMATQEAASCKRLLGQASRGTQRPQLFPERQQHRVSLGLIGAEPDQPRLFGRAALSVAPFHNRSRSRDAAGYIRRSVFGASGRRRQSVPARSGVALQRAESGPCSEIAMGGAR